MRNIRYIIAALIAVFSLATYYCNTQKNPITGESQHVAMSVEQEIGLGLEAAPQMMEQYGGLHPNQEAQALVDKVGQKVVQENVPNSPYRFDFHLLADEQTVNAFALPGGQIFITAALMNRLQNEEQLAGVLGHEVGHVVNRHSAEHMAKAKLTQGLTGAGVIAAYDPSNPGSISRAAMVAAVGQLINMKYGRDDELESDRFGVQYMINSGYNPSQMIEVMKILEQAGGGGARRPEFMSTHPDPGNRIAHIQKAIQEFGAGDGTYPTGDPNARNPQSNDRQQDW